MLATLALAFLVTAGAGVVLLLDDRGADDAGRGGVMAPPAPSSLVVGDFEHDLTTAGWRLSPEAGTVSLTATRARSGSSSLRVVGGSTGPRASATSAPVSVNPGQSYALGAFSLVASGRQELSLTFRDLRGRALATTSSATGATTGAWSRVALSARAPEQAVSAAVTLAASVGDRSIVNWDDLALVSSAVPDGGLETPARDSDCPVQWTCGASEGARAERTTTRHRSGTAALLLTDSSTDHASWARTSLVPVTPSVGHTVTAWFRIDGGTPGPTMTVRWYDAGRHLIGDGGPPGRSSGDTTWRRLEVTRTSPDAAAYVSIDLATSETGTGELLWDDLAVAPAEGGARREWDTEQLARLDGFATTTTSRIVDLRGRPKLVTVVSGDPATLEVADVQTGTVEQSSPLPGLVHGWGLTEGSDRHSVFVGAGAGHLARYDLVTRSLTDLGRATPRSTLVFDLATGPDGRIWGASYPAGEVWSWAPAGGFRVLEPLGSGHDYARSIAVDKDWVYVGTGSTGPDIVRISVADPTQRTTITLPDPVDTGFVVDLDLHGRYLAARLPEGRRGVYDTLAGTWDVPLARDEQGHELRHPPTVTAVDGAPFYFFTGGLLWQADPRLTGSGAKRAVAIVPTQVARDRAVVRTRISGVLGDWIISFDGIDTVTALEVSALSTVNRPPTTATATLPRPLIRTFPLRLRASPVPIKSLAIGSSGEVLVGGFGGSNLSVLDPRDESPQLTPLISDPIGRDAFGEVEGMVSNGRFDFFGSYTEARIFRRDSTQPWVDGENPRMLTKLGPSLGQDRPIAWTTAGSRTVFGTIPQYGRLGGVLGWFDGEETVPHTVWSPVADQSVVALSGEGSVVYGGTSRWGGLGVQPTTPSAEVFAYDLGSSTPLWHVAPVGGAQAFAAVAVADGRLWAATRATLVELDPTNGTVLRRIPLLPAVEPDSPTYRSVDLAVVDGHVVVAAQGALHSVDIETLQVSTIAATGISPPRVRAVGGVLYFPSRSVLMKATPR